MKWQDSGLNQIVNNLVNVGACTIGNDNTPISSIGASNAMGYLSGTQEARITNGILYRFEERTGGYIEVKNLGISAKVKRMGITVPATVKANIQTTAPRDYNLFTNDQTYAESLNDGTYEGGIAVAEDTYGLAVDLWVRTNAAASYLTLEGNVLTESETVRAVTKDPNGNEVEVWTITGPGEDDEGNDVYQEILSAKGEPLVAVWYYADSHTAVYYQEGEGNSAKWYIPEVYNSEEATKQPLEKNPVPVAKMTELITVIGFEGENRVWDESKMLSVDATTQGSGSCYVYYADTPEDQARSLKLLEAFNVAFVDSKGKLMATAIMDTEHFYAESGRVTVPLVLDTGSSINLGENYQGEITYAIAALEQNVPTRITAIVYLDGTKLNNQDVLSAADIQGKLNIQFGSSDAMQPISNEKLENEILKVSATVDKTEFNYDEASDSNPMTTHVVVNVEGSEPNTVTAFFLRAISDTQGSREETITFTQDANGKWGADYTFTSPGRYILRTIRLDGVDYDLAAPQSVLVKGFTVQSLSCDEASNNHVRVMTAGSSSTVNLKMKFATDDPTKMPRTVQGRFLRDEDGSAVNINFTLDPTTQIWSGTATFLSSGEYTLQYLLLNGDYVALDEGMHQTATVYLGMRAAVYTASPYVIKYVPSELAENEKMLAMQVSIMDNNGNQMPGLSDVKLTYGMKGSGTKKMDTDLIWNGSYYVGELCNAGPGIWQFSTLNVGSNVITYATTSPTFTVQSPEPPAYYDHRTISYQFSPENTAVMNAQITNSAAAAVQAYIVKQGQTEGVWVDGTIGGELTTENGASANNWTFKVPTDANGYQDGNWQMTQLKLWDVFAADGTPYTEEEPLVIDVSGKNIVSKVVSKIHISFAENKSQDFGKDASGNVTAAFMTQHRVSGVAVNIQDFEGKSISGIKDVKLSYVWQNNSQAYGGYTGASLTNAQADFTIDLTDDGSGTKFVQTESKTLLYAGSYQTTFSFMVGDKTESYSGENLPNHAPVFTVSSVAPQIQVVQAYYKSADSEDACSVTGSTINMYYYKYTQKSCGVTYNKYYQPNATINLSGFGNASEANLTFAESSGGDVRLYVKEEDKDNNRTASFTWTADGNCQRWVGFWDGQTGSDKATAAGTIKATTLTLKYGGVDYQVDIADITINNPAP